LDVRAMLAGKEKDFLLQPGDIIYVNDRPWYKVEQVLDSAMRSFLQSTTSSWTNVNVPELITSPFLNQQNWNGSQ
jgi:hypothetical protein